MLQIEPGFNVHLAFDKKCQEGNEAILTITCFDDYPFPQYRKTKDDLESYVVRKFGSMILQDRRKPSNLDLSSSCKGIPLKHPMARKDRKEFPSYQDNFNEEYYLPLTKEQLREANSTLVTNQRILPDHIKKISGYESDMYVLRMGKWH